jgi:predicted PurR-regulated permease PerM
MSDQLEERLSTATQAIPSAGSRWPARLIAVGVILALCYVAKLVLTVLLVSILLAFVLAPVVDFLGMLRMPRGLSSLIAVLLLLALLYTLTYASYNEAANFVQVLPRYSARIRSSLMRFRQQAESFYPLLPGEEDEKNDVTLRSETPWNLLARSFGSLTQALLSLSFIPFLVYFMLSWHPHVRSATVMLFPMEHRHRVYVTLGQISGMIRSFMVGNLLIGIFMALTSVAVFALFHLPFFFVIGVVSGFVSLIPYAGVLLALAPPLLVGLEGVSSGDLILIVLFVAGLHLLAMNVLYPKFLGNRLQLNPLAVTIALLFWGWLWGGIGLLLAIPIVGAMKIIFDNVTTLRPYGVWLGE